MKRKIAIAGDHAGFEYKEILKKHLEDQFEIQDFGTFSTDSVDYPILCILQQLRLRTERTNLEFLSAEAETECRLQLTNIKKIRCALCWMPEIAELARQHNDANMISIPARFISKEVAIEIANRFLSTDFEGGRHLTRVDKIAFC